MKRKRIFSTIGTLESSSNLKTHRQAKKLKISKLYTNLDFIKVPVLTC